MVPENKLYNYDYYMSLPEGDHIEIINGQVYNMASAPNRIHQEISGELFYIIKNYLQGKNCKVYNAPFYVFLLDDDSDIRYCKNIVQPDISVICDKNKLFDKGCKGAPDFIIEIVSPSSRSMDYIKKVSVYLDNGVKEYWIVDPNENKIRVYCYNANDIFTKDFTFSDNIKVSVFDDLVIDFALINVD